MPSEQARFSAKNHKPRKGSVSSSVYVKLGKQASNSKLVKELKRLKYLLGIEENLQICWIPNLRMDVDGEVRDGVIYIYVGDEKSALEVLRHELVDYLLTTRLVKPLVDLINLLIKHREGEIYREKENLVKVFCRLLESCKA